MGNVVTGTVANRGTTSVAMPEVTLFSVDSGGRPIDFGYASSQSDLAVGSSWSFQATIPSPVNGTSLSLFTDSSSSLSIEQPGSSGMKRNFASGSSKSLPTQRRSFPHPSAAASAEASLACARDCRVNAGHDVRSPAWTSQQLGKEGGLGLKLPADVANRGRQRKLGPSCTALPHDPERN
jgi:hypothetical protein